MAIRVAPEPAGVGADIADEAAYVLRRPIADPPTRTVAYPAVRRSSGRVTMAAIFVAAILVALAGHVFDIEEARLAGTLGVVLFGIGSAPLQLAQRLDLAARLGLSPLVGLTVLIGVGALMADIDGLWRPVPAAILVGGIAMTLHAVGLYQECVRPGRRSMRERWSLIRHPAAIPLPAVVAVAGTALWLGSAIAAGHIEPGIAGLVTQISPFWFAGVGMVLVAIAFARSNGRLLGFSALSFALATTLTPALVYGAPRSQSAAKQVDLVMYIVDKHHIATDAGIYQAYSALFAGAAWLCHIAGVSNPLDLATYWPVALAVVRVAALRLLFGRIFESTRSCWLAVTLVLLVDALGGDYFSPQSVGYVMALGIYALVIRRASNAEAGAGATLLGPVATFVLLALASIVLGPTHELTPFLVAGVLVVLVVFGKARWWTPVVVLVPAAAWAAIHYDVVSHFLSFGSLLDASNFAPPKTAANADLERLPIVGLNSGALLVGLLILIAVAGIGLLRNFRASWAWCYAICSGVGLVFVAINPYGNEGIFRVALFGIPWLAALAVFAMVPRSQAGARDRAPVASPLALTALFGVLLATFTVATYGLDGSNVMHRADFNAAKAFDRHAPRGAVIMAVGYGDNPVQGPRFNRTDDQSLGVNWKDVVQPPMLVRGHPTEADFVAMEREYLRQAQDITGEPVTGLYALWSPTLEHYSAEYGLQSRSQSRAWLRLFQHSDWQLVYEQDGSYLFRRSVGDLSPAATPGI